jgi:hypothetical protein
MMTLELSANSQQLEVLTSGLGCGIPRVVELCSQALLAQGSLQAQVALISAAAHPSPVIAEKIRANAETLSGAFRQLLIHGSPAQKLTALTAIEITETFEPGPALVELVRSSPVGEVAERSASTLRQMAWHLHELTEHGREKRLHPTLSALAANYRPRIVAALSNGLELEVDHLQVDQIAVRELLIECLLIIARDDAPEIRRILWSSNASIREIVRHLMLHGTHPGIVRAIIGSLGHSYPHPRALDAVQERDDPEFVVELLKTVSRPTSPKMMQNLRQIGYVTWLTREPLDLSWIPGEYQAGVIHLVNHTRLSRECRRNVEDWLLRHGTTEGREAAAGSAAHHDEAMVKEVVRSSLDSSDSVVAAWACSQLKIHQFPDAARLLMEKLRSANAEVREVARHELREWFNAERMLELHESMTAEVGVQAGRMLLEVDDLALPTFEVELHHGIRHRRIRALMTIDKLGIEKELQSSLMTMLADLDPLVRRTVVDVLAKIPNLDSVLAIQYLTHDESHRVRDAAVSAYKRLQKVVESIDLSREATGTGELGLNEETPSVQRPLSPTDDSGILAWVHEDAGGGTSNRKRDSKEGRQ